MWDFIEVGDYNSAFFFHSIIYLDIRKSHGRKSACSIIFQVVKAFLPTVVSKSLEAHYYIKLHQESLHARLRRILQRGRGPNSTDKQRLQMDSKLLIFSFVNTLSLHEMMRLHRLETARVGQPLSALPLSTTTKSTQ